MALPEQSTLTCHQTQRKSRFLQGQGNVLMVGEFLILVDSPRAGLVVREQMVTGLPQSVLPSCTHLFGQILAPFFFKRKKKENMQNNNILLGVSLENQGLLFGKSWKADSAAAARAVGTWDHISTAFLSVRVRSPPGSGVRAPAGSGRCLTPPSPRQHDLAVPTGLCWVPARCQGLVSCGSARPAATGASPPLGEAP